MSLSCTACERKFSFKSNLTRHMRVVHNVQMTRTDIMPGEFNVYHYKCLEGCNISFKYNRELRCHLRNDHDVDLVEVNLEFPNSAEFSKWLYDEETNNCVQYVHATATKKRSMVETFYYECSRTGKRNQLDENHRKRKMKKHGTQKLNRGCTSQIIANKTYDGSYNVTYFKTHYGHEIELEHIKLTKQDRGAIASKLLLGIPVTSVLHSVQSKSGSLKRINLLRRKDVFNIKRSFNIDLKDGKLVSGDAININSFIAECSRQEFDPILFYNLQEASTADICLMIMSKYQSEVLLECSSDNIIVINSTPLNDCSFELTTLFVVYENGESFPGACMFSNKTDLFIYKLFFTKIREKIGKLSPKVFVSNVNEVYYEAWRMVMGEVSHDFYNPVQVDLDWKLNMNRITTAEAGVTKVKRKWVLDTLKIMQSIREETEFVENFEETIKLLDDDPDFKEFLSYFLDNYSNPKKWADCYRASCNLHSAHLELTSDILKQYLDKETRFDKIFHSLIRFIRDETVNCMTKAKSAQVLFVSENDSRHQTPKDFSIETISDKVWNITEDNATCVVQRHLLEKCCNLICTTCRICIHCFSCTCADFFVNNAICVHIHNIWMTFFHSLTAKEHEEFVCDEEIIIKVDEDVGVPEEVRVLQNEILAKTARLCTNVPNVSCTDTLRIILETVSHLLELSETPSETNLVVEEQPPDAVLNDHSYL